MHRTTAPTPPPAAGNGALSPRTTSTRALRILISLIAALGVLVPTIATAASTGRAGHGVLSASTSPAVASQISVDGTARNVGTLTNLELPVGPHQVCFSAVTDHITPACQTVQVEEGRTTDVVGTFAPAGSLVVKAEPSSLAPVVTVDGVERDRAAVALLVATGSHEVCFGAADGHQAPPCQTTTVEKGRTSTVTGTYTPTPAAKPAPAEPTQQPAPEEPAPEQPSQQPAEEAGSEDARPTAQNLLSRPQHTFDSDPVDWIMQGNTTLRRDGRSSDAAGSLLVTVDRKGSYPDSTRTARVGTRPGTKGIAASSGQTYSGYVRIQPLDGRMETRCEIRWYNSRGKIIRTDAGALTTTTAGSWTPVTCEATAPSGTRTAGLRVFAQDVAYGRQLLLDEAWFVRGDLGVQAAQPAQPAPEQEQPKPQPTQQPQPQPQPTQQPAPQPEPQPEQPAEPAPAPQGGVSHGSQLTANNTGLAAAGYRYDRGSDTWSHPKAGRLTPSGTIVTSRDGQVIENVDVRGEIVVKHNNVTIRNCRVTYSGTDYAIDARRNSPRGTTIEACSLRTAGSKPFEAFGVYIADGTVRWTDITRFQVGVFVNGGNTRVEYTRVTDAQSTSGTHGTGMSANRGASNIVFNRNYITGNTSAALSLYAHQGPYSNVTVSENLLDGGNYGSFCLNAGNNKDGVGRNTGIKVTGNEFSRATYPQCGQYGPFFNWDGSRPGNAWCDNRWADGSGVVGKESGCR